MQLNFIKSTLSLLMLIAFTPISHASTIEDFPELKLMLEDAQNNGSSITDDQMEFWLESAQDKFPIFSKSDNRFEGMTKQEVINELKQVKYDFSLFLYEVDGQKSVEFLPTTNAQIDAAFDRYILSDTSNSFTEEDMKQELYNLPNSIDDFLSLSIPPKWER